MTSSRIVYLSILSLFGAFFFCVTASAQAPASAGNSANPQTGFESALIAADRKALSDAQASGDSARILAAKEKLSDDLAAQQVRPAKKDKNAVKKVKDKKKTQEKASDQKSDLIKADEKALQDAQASGDPVKIKAAQDKLNADLQQGMPAAHDWKFNTSQ
jgi:hypothetical protein